MTNTESSSLFEYALSSSTPTNIDEEVLMELHAALGISKPPATLLHFPAAKRQPDWQRYLYAAIAAALIIAMIGVSFRYLTTDPNPEGDDVASVPPVVLGLASPETSSACNGTRSIPIISGATSAPEGITAILLTPDGELILDCEGRQEVLATGVQSVNALAWPGVVFLVNADNSSTYLNVFTRATFDVQLTEPFTSPRSTLGLLNNRNSGRLEVVPATTDPGHAAILDLDTFTETPLVDHRGEPIRVTEISALTANYRGDCVALAYSTHVLMQNTDYLDGFVRVSADGGTSAMAARDSLQPVPRELAISPDCDIVASVAFQGEPMMGTTKVTVQSFTDITASATYSAETPDTMTHITWLKSGGGFIFGAGDVFYWQAPFETAEPVSLGDDLMVDTIMLTRDPNVVAISVVDWSGGGSRTLIFNAATGETLVLESADVYPNTDLLPPERNTLIMRTSPVQIYDAATGAHLGDVGDETTDMQTTIVAEIDPYGSAEIGLIGSSLDDLWRILDANGDPTMEKIDPPSGLEADGMPTVAMSRDGWIYLAGATPGGNGWLKNLDEPTGDWIEVTFDPTAIGMRVQFLPRGDQEAIPEATPVANQSACDLSQDSPLLLYANDFPLDATTLILNDDGDLLFRCAGTDEVILIATEVVDVRSTGWPSTVIVSTEVRGSQQYVNGIPATSMLVNLETGDQLKLGTGSLDMRFLQDLTSPWYLAFIDDGTRIPHLVNLQSLEAHALQPEELGAPAMIAMATSSHNGSVTAAAILHDKYSLGQRSLDTEGETTSLEIVVIGETWDDRTTLSIDNIGGFASGISMSPDGRCLTIEVLDSVGVGGNSEPTQLLVIDTSTGEIVAHTDETVNSQITNTAWTSDSSTFLYLTDNKLMALVPETSDSPHEVFTGELSLSNLALTADPNVVLVMDGESENGAVYHRVHLDTGESQLIGQQGWEVGLLGFERHVPIISLSDGDTITWQDSATGEILEQSTPTSTPEAQPETPTVNLYFDSPIYAGAISESFTIWVWDEDLQVRKIQAPDTPAEIFQRLAETTPDGRYIIVSEIQPGYLIENPITPRTLFVMDTWNDTPTWIPVKSDWSATPTASSTACDLTQDIPLFIGMDESPIESTAVLLTSDGEMVLSCNGTRETLLDGVTAAYSGRYPGVILIESTAGTGFYNLQLRQMFTLSDSAFVESPTHMQANALRTLGRWWIVPSSDDASRASLLDLQTLTETQLADGSGSRLLLTDVGVVATNEGEDTVVIAISYYRPDLRSTFLRGYAVVVDGKQVEFQEEYSTLPVPRELAVAPDGAHYAVATYQGDQNSGTVTIEVFTRNTASPIKTISLTTPNRLTDLTWLTSGEGLVYTDSSNVYLLPAPYATSDPEVLLESANVTEIALTRDPDVVTVTSFLPAQVIGSPPETAIVNTRTGEVTALEGLDMFLPSFLQPVDRNVLLLQTSMITRTDGDNNVRAYDAATGELLGEIERPVQAGNGFSSSQYGYGRGEIGVIAFQADSMWLLLDNGQPVLTRIPAPEVLPATTPMSIRMSEDGWLFTWANGPLSRGWLMAPGSSEWIEVRFTGDIQSSEVDFIVGLGN